ncbi:hypothetical protein NitYY0826_C1234 [Nitratiruptor sp. YY08-26]|uniref:hypothetical protein n=1 Tax=unclassified Nitratiruptor TaxID=2624044 RepID=UPI0019151DCB|nr:MULTISPECIES: hypothetical protein [unclassified Nitratiruptor]BCD62358.1 hypothetical protein NitYY0813_C1232 [Nitratiruptor sp. YY08-13]BCD66294.1 hypothetical protein NitYY0826_C1234 [Nitratiruptor sp. YY08-26]
MRTPLLENVISFLLGVLWTLMGISVFFVFITTYHSSIIFAIALSLLIAAFWLFIIVVLEMANLQIEKLKEMKKQTRLLQEIRHRLEK